MNKLTILKADANEKSGTFEDDNGKERSYTTRKQDAKFEDANGFIYPFDVRLEDGQRPWPVGDYSIDWDAMVSVNKRTANLSKFHVLTPYKAK